MFNSRKRLQSRTTSKDLSRPDYLQELVSEFQDTKSKDAKEQVLANLANFAYDPINYDYLRDLHVIDLLIDSIDTDEDINGNLVQYGVGGLCNLAADIKNRQHILGENRSIPLIIRCLSSAIEETVLSAITTLMLLIVPESRHRIVIMPVIECMQRFAAMCNPRYKNLAMIFLEDYCNPEERAAALRNPSGSYLFIPVPETP